MLSNAKSLNKVESLQERALSFLYEDYVSLYELLQKAGKETMKGNRLRSLCIEICKLINNINPMYMNEIFKPRKISRVVRSNYKLNDTHRKRLFFTQFSTGMAGWLLLIFLICLYNQLSSIHSIIRCLKNVIHQIDSKNRWLLLSASFTAKFGLVFVLTLENAFS